MENLSHYGIGFRIGFALGRPPGCFSISASSCPALRPTLILMSANLVAACNQVERDMTQEAIAEVMGLSQSRVAEILGEISATGKLPKETLRLAIRAYEAGAFGEGDGLYHGKTVAASQAKDRGQAHLATRIGAGYASGGTQIVIARTSYQTVIRLGAWQGRSGWYRCTSAQFSTRCRTLRRRRPRAISVKRFRVGPSPTLKAGPVLVIPEEVAAPTARAGLQTPCHPSLRRRTGSSLGAMSSSWR